MLVLSPGLHVSQGYLSLPIELDDLLSDRVRDEFVGPSKPAKGVHLLLQEVVLDRSSSHLRPSSSLPLFVHVGLGLGTLSKEGLLGTGASLIQIWVGLHTHQTQVLPSLVIVLGSLDGVELHQIVEHFLLLCCAMESHVCLGLPN